MANDYGICNREYRPPPPPMAYWLTALRSIYGVVWRGGHTTQPSRLLRILVPLCPTYCCGDNFFRRCAIKKNGYIYTLDSLALGGHRLPRQASCSPATRCADVDAVLSWMFWCEKRAQIERFVTKIYVSYISSNTEKGPKQPNQLPLPSRTSLEPRLTLTGGIHTYLPEANVTGLRVNNANSTLSIDVIHNR